MEQPKYIYLLLIIILLFSCTTPTEPDGNQENTQVAFIKITDSEGDTPSDFFSRFDLFIDDIEFDVFNLSNVDTPYNAINSGGDHTLVIDYVDSGVNYLFTFEVLNNSSYSWTWKSNNVTLNNGTDNATFITNWNFSLSNYYTLELYDLFDP